MKRVILFSTLFLFILTLVSAQVCVNNIQINNPQGVIVDNSGARYIADTNNNRIIRIDSSGNPTVFAGDPSGTMGFVDSSGTSARFNQPHKMMIYGNFLYVADSGNDAIRTIDLSTQSVTTVVGNGQGFADGSMAVAEFNNPKGLYITSNGDIFVADTGNNRIRRISSGQVTTVAGGGTSGINCATPNNCLSNSAPPLCASMQFNSPEDVFVYSSGSPAIYDIYIADTGNHAIERISSYNPSGAPTNCYVTLIAGSGTAGYNQGGTSTQLVQFNSPTAIESVNYNSVGPVSDPNYNIFVADKGNNMIRQIYTAGGYTVAYKYAGEINSGSNDGQTSNPYTGNPLSTARFNSISDIFIKANSFYPYTGVNDFVVADSGNDKLRSISGTSSNGVWNVGTVSAGSCATGSNTCPSSDDIILRLSSPTNAHGEEWNGAGGYSTEVCYSEIFGTTYTGSNPHSCISGDSNLVLRLSSPTNAHGEIPDATANAYTTNVCYGDLSCQSVAGDSVCPSGTQEVLSLSDPTNAHIENRVANVYSSNSNYKVCCSNTVASGIGTISVAQWEYFNGNKIPQNTLLCPNSYLVASAYTSGLPAGSQVTFNIYDEDLLDNDLIAGGIVATTDASGVARGYFNLADPVSINLMTGFVNEAFENGELELFFDALIPTDNKQSERVRYTLDVNLCQFNPPTATVTAPVHQGVYFADTPINFVATCSSDAGPLTYNWQLVQNGNTISNTNPTFSYNFAQGGQVTVTLSCTDLQGISVQDQVQILVVASPFTFAYISDPSFNGVEYNPPSGFGTPYFPREVSFGATDTFAVDTSGACSINCVGGNCPSQTQNSPSSCGGGPISISGAPSSPSNAVWGGMNFDWTFWDNDWTNQGNSIDGASVTGAVEYDDVSENLNDKHMSVSVQAVSGGVTASASFQRDFTLGRCLNNGNTLLNSAGELKSTTSPNICNGGDGNPNSGDECCPSGRVCADTENDGSYSCEFLENPITKCQDFTDSDSCKTNTNPAYPLESNGGVFPATACSILECFWDESLGCGVRQINYPTGPNGQCDVTQGCVLSDCAWTTTQTECINGRKTVQYSGNLVGTSGIPICDKGSNSCSREPVTVPCGSLNFELGFFGIKQFIATAIIVALFYIICGMKRND